MKTRVPYRFIGSFCDHQHPAPAKDDPFNHGWERLVLAFRSRDWFSGPVNAFLKAECAKLGIPWLSFRPHSKPTAFAIVLATQMNAQLPQVSDEEHEQSWGMWAVLEQGASIFQNTCVVPSCAN